MRGKLKKIFSLALAVMLVIGIAPISAKTVRAEGTEPVFDVRFVDSSNQPIETARPGEQVRAIVSVSNAERLSTFKFRMEYDMDVFEPTRRSSWSDTVKNYMDQMKNGYVDDSDEWHDPVADVIDLLSADADMPIVGTMMVTRFVDEPISGVGNCDIATIYFNVAEDASGDFDFTVQKEGYMIDGKDKTESDERITDNVRTLTIEKEPVPMTSFTLSDEEISLDLSGTTEHKLSVASYEPTDTTDTDKPVTWSTDNDKVATVDENGNVTAVGKGVATITASITNNNGDVLTQQCTVTVVKSVTAITLQPESMTLANGQTKQITATVLPENADDANVTWTSNDPSVATVDEKGNVEAVGENGTTTITASTANGTKASCAVTVKTSHLEDIGLSETSVDLARNEKKELEVSFTPELSNVTDEVTDVTWTTENDSIVTVTAVDGSDHKQKAEINALKAGTTKITATVESNGKTYSKECEVIVYVPVEEISLPAMVGDNGTILKGESVTVSAKISPDDADKYDLQWTVGTEGVVEITPSTDGKSCTITGLKDGKAAITITDKISGETAQTVITVKEIQINKVTVTTANDKTELNKGETLQATATVEPAGTTDDKSVTWSSSDESVATVDQNGKITAVGGGTAIISATSDARKDVTGTVEITVNVPLNSIKFAEGAEDTLLRGQQTTLKVIYDPDDTTVDKTVTWEISDPAKAEYVDNKDGTATVKGLKAGKVTVTARVADKEVSTEITVEEKNITGAELNIKGTQTVDLKDKSLDVELLLTPEDFTDVINVEWSSSDTEVATVSGDEEKATITFVNDGTTEIKATVTTDAGKEYTATCTIVVEIPMTGIKVTEGEKDVTGSTLALLKGETKTLGYAADPENTTDKITNVEWTSSDPESVSIVNNSVGTATAETIKASDEPVMVTVTATLESGEEFEAEVYISAKEIPIQSITLNKTSVTLEAKENETTTLEVTYNPENTTDEKTVTWSSNNPAVATVDQNGVVTAVAGGTAKITARTANGKTATCEVKVPIHITEVEAEDMQLIRGEEGTVTAKVLPDNTDDDKTLSYVIDDTKGDEGVIKLDGNTVTALKEGTAYVIVTAEGAYDDVSTTIKVVVTEKHLTAIDVTSSGTYNEEDDAYHLRADEKDPKISVSWDKDITDDVEVSYSVAEGEDVAGVDENGNLTFYQEGYATIRVAVTATDGSGNTKTLTEDRKFYVDVIELEDIAFAEDSQDVTINVGEDKTLTIIYTPEDTTDKTVTWTSSDPSIATVTAGADGTAVVKGIKAGEVTITVVSESGLETTTTVTVKETAKDPEKDPGKKDPTDNPDKTQKPGQDDKKDDTDKTGGAVDTGDTTTPVPFAVTAILALGVIFIVMRRRFRNTY